jgi:hypothetical protein
VNTPTLITYLVLAASIAVLLILAVRQMIRGWLHRVQRQAGSIGLLPALPETVGPAIVAPTKGMYVGSTFAPSWQNRIAVGALGFRSKAVLTRYPEGIMLQLTGGSPIWIPDESITTIRTERGIAGKVLTYDGILAIRWRLPSGTEIDTGFRSDDRRELTKWVEEDAA